MKKRLFALAMSAALAVTSAFALVGCGVGNANDENTLEIQAYNRGYGVDGLKAVIENFKTKNPEITVILEETTDNTTGKDIYNGPSAVSTDLYLHGGDNFFRLIRGGKVTIDGVEYDNYFENLNEVYEYVPEGETKPIKEKMFPAYEQFYNMKDGEQFTEDTYYAAPWMASICGLVYNSKMFERYGWDIPVTTDELAKVSDAIISTDAKSTNKNSTGQDIDIAAFSYCLQDSYWSYVYLQWWAQYDGILKYNNFFDGKDENGVYTPAIGASDGRKEMLKVFDQLLGTYKKEGSNIVKRNNVYCDPTLSTRSFIDTQATFLGAEASRINTNGATTSAMMPNGDWLESEMYTNFGDMIERGEIAFKMLRTPVVSAIRNHPDCEGTIESDAELSALIKAIDAGNTALSGEGYSVSQKAYDKIKEARNMSYVNTGFTAYVPAFATGKEAAKKFLKYLYSDEGLIAWTSATKGQSLPFTYEWNGIEGLSDFQKSKFNIIETSENFAISSDKSALVNRGGLQSFYAYTPFESKFNVSSKNDYLDPETIFIENYNEINRLWSNILTDAGIN